MSDQLENAIKTLKSQGWEVVFMGGEGYMIKKGGNMMYVSQEQMIERANTPLPKDTPIPPTLPPNMTPNQAKELIKALGGKVRHIPKNNQSYQPGLYWVWQYAGDVKAAVLEHELVKNALWLWGQVTPQEQIEAYEKLDFTSSPPPPTPPTPPAPEPEPEPKQKELPIPKEYHCLFCGVILTGRKRKYCSEGHRKKYERAMGDGTLAGVLAKQYLDSHSIDLSPKDKKNTLDLLIKYCDMMAQGQEDMNRGESFKWVGGLLKVIKRGIKE